MTARGSGRARPVSAPGPRPVDPRDHLAVRRLTHAATHSAALLIAEAAVLAEGWVVLVDPVAGPVHSAPPGAGPSGARAAASPQAYPQLTVHHVAGGVLVLGPGRATSPERAALIARTTADLLRVRARRADETSRAEQRLHTAILRLLLAGEHRLAVDVLGGTTATHATVYRLTGHAAPVAHQALWRAARPGTADPRVLICLERGELVVLALHDGGTELAGRHPAHPLIAGVAERHRLTGASAAPVPLDMVPAAWPEAGSPVPGPAGDRLGSAVGLGAGELLRVIPADRLAAWASAVLGPLGHERRRILECRLRTGSALAAAGALGLSEGTVRSRLRAVGTLLAVDLDDPTVQARLLLALRAPAGSPPVPGAGPVAAPGVPSRPAVPTALLTPDEARRWAADVLEPLDTRLRIALRQWLLHRGRTAPAAAALGVHRSTLTAWLTECGGLLGVDLSSATVRSELHLALETAAGPGDDASALPRRGGRTYRAPRL
ncbi:helix-turn-helix domain-containing protein [Streptomyces sp. NPDC020875]|uniref:PucR family transcriptional regulator n=1 Tax=Streptomyces sp. NPDC020875 TaxID=3154898 RepID=UPI003407C94C